MSLSRILALLTAIVMLAAQPALAQSVLPNYVGTWQGSGQVTGPDGGNVKCRMVFRQTNAGKLNYTGRCSLAQGSQSFTGTLVYNEGANRYEAIGSAQGVTTQSVGKQQGSSIVFSSSGSDTKFGTASSTLVFSPSQIQVKFKLVNPKGETMTSDIALTKS
ncbi:MAG: hypothetical protein JWR75_245 [Devosia sp.]|nr:hypothetical protein [Devosia sp.]